METKELKEALEELKSSLEKANEAKIKAIEEKNAVSLKEAQESIEALKKELADKQKELSDKQKEFEDWKVSKDEADKKNQEVIDNHLKAEKRAKLSGVNTKSFGDIIKEAVQEKTDDLIKLSRRELKDGKVSIDLKAAADVTTSNVTGGTAWGDIKQPGIIMNPNRKVHIRQIVPVGTIGPGTQYVFMRENGDGEGVPAPTAETGTKPQFDVDLVESSVDIETIAGWMRVTRKAMNNIPGFISFLQQRLPEKLLKVEDSQLLTGDGVSPNIKGIMTAGNYTAATTTAGVLVERIIDSLAQLEDDEERDATGILLRPKEYYNFFKNKADGSGEYDLPQNVAFANGTLYISGVPVFMSTAMTDGKFIVGDWRMGAQLLIQEGMRIEFFEQDTDNVQKNKITIRIEETIAFPVYGDNYFIVGDNEATT